MAVKVPQKSETTSAVIHMVCYLLPLIVLGLAVHLILPQMTSLEHSIRVIKGMTVWALALAVVVVLTYRIFSFWLPLMLGFPLILTLQNSGRVKNT